VLSFISSHSPLLHSILYVSLRTQSQGVHCMLRAFGLFQVDPNNHRPYPFLALLSALSVFRTAPLCNSPCPDATATEGLLGIPFLFVSGVSVRFIWFCISLPPFGQFLVVVVFEKGALHRTTSGLRSAPLFDTSVKQDFAFQMWHLNLLPCYRAPPVYFGGMSCFWAAFFSPLTVPHLVGPLSTSAFRSPVRGLS